MQLAWSFVVISTLAELLVFTVEYYTGGAQNPQQYLFVYVLRPLAGYLLIMLVVQLASRWLLANGRYMQQAMVYLTGAVGVVTLLCWTHATVPPVHLLFAFPILLSLVYSRQWLLNYSGAISLLGLCVVLFLLPPTWPLHQGESPDYVNVVSTIAILAAFYFLAIMLLRRQQGLLEKVETAHKKSKQDSLTQLYNHAAFYEELDERIIGYNKKGRQFTLIIFDLDNFKSINDRFGHAVGDVVITTLVSCIRAALREGEEAFRYGGEEFTVLSYHSAEECVQMANDVLASFTSTLSDPSWGRPLTCSAGVARYEGERFGAKREFFAAADEALYQAKRCGKNQTVLWDEALSRRWMAFQQTEIKQDDTPPPAG